MTNPFPFSVANPNTPYRHGSLCWMVVLPDGREVQLSVGAVTVTSAGVLQVWQTHETGREFPGETPLPEPTLLLALAPGAWVSAYAASCLDTSPICVVHVPAPKTRKAKA